MLIYKNNKKHIFSYIILINKIKYTKQKLGS